MKKSPNLMLLVVLGFTFFGFAAFFSPLSFAQNLDARGQPGPTPLKALAASGYCPSSGGSTSYEHITSATLEALPDGQTLRLTVQVYIQNPNGCTSGKPCPEYTNPEYVNAWIDWNGNFTFDQNETVMNEAGTGYQNINYTGNMSFVKQFTIPENHATSTWMRVNLGYGYDPNDPCQLSWSWGNVLDKQVEIAATPKIKEISVSPVQPLCPVQPPLLPQPMTTKDVKFEAKTEGTDGYTTKFAWTFEGLPQTLEGNPVTLAPADDYRGKRKVTCKMTYEKGGVSNFTSKDQNFNVYFEKNADKGGQPKWYVFWKADGAVSGLASATYSGTLSGYGDSWVDGNTSHVRVSKIASGQHYDNSLGPINGHMFGGPSVKGIDCAAEVEAHEKEHNRIALEWKTGAWKNLSQTDNATNTDFKARGPGDIRDYNDMLPNSHESTVGTDPRKVDSFDIATKKNRVYKYYGDWEYFAMLAGDGARGVAAKDWACPGRQAGGNETLTSVAAGVASASSVGAAVYRSGVGGESAPKTSSQRPEMKRVLLLRAMGAPPAIGLITEQVTDNNGNGLFDYLTLEVEVTPKEAMGYNLVGFLEDQSGTEIAWASTVKTLVQGTQKVKLRFSGLVIGKSKTNGPYVLTRIELRIAEDDYVVDYLEDAYTTSAYNFSDFEQPDVSFQTGITDSGKDLNANGKYDVLEVAVPFQINKPGDYIVRGWLYSNTGKQIAYAAIKNTYTAGTHQALLNFDGKALYHSHEDGPYQLKDLLLLDSAENQLDSLNQPYSTEAYQYSDFEGGSANLNSYGDFAEDTDGDSKYDKLVVTVNLSVLKAGTYYLDAWLVDSTGKAFSKAGIEVDFSAMPIPGNQTANLVFLGKDIFGNGVDGPFHVKEVSVVDSAGAIADRQVDAYTTKTYNHEDFNNPLVYASGVCSDEATDLDGDGIYDSLVIGLTVTSKQAGVVKAEGALADSTGSVIAWSTGYVEISPNTPTALNLTFNANDIAKSCKNGPYHLANLNVYNTYDPSQNFFVEESCPTDVYQFNKFGYTEGMMLNISQSTWNLFSINVSPTDNSVEKVFEKLSNSYDVIWAFQDGVWRVFYPSNPGFSDLLNIDPGFGYWIRLNGAPQYLPVPGVSASGYEIALEVGWNLVGFNSETSLPIADALSSISGKYTIVWAFIDGSWKSYHPQNPAFSDLTVMQPGLGYWVKVSEACTWTLP